MHSRAGPHVHVLPQASDPWQSSPVAQSAAVVHALGWGPAAAGGLGGGGAGQPRSAASIALKARLARRRRARRRGIAATLHQVSSVRHPFTSRRCLGRDGEIAMGYCPEKHAWQYAVDGGLPASLPASPAGASPSTVRTASMSPSSER